MERDHHTRVDDFTVVVMKKKEFRTLRVRLNPYRKLSIIVCDKLCDLYFGGGFRAGKKRKKGW